MDETISANQTDAPSGFRQLVGYRVSEWRDGEAAIVLTIGPRHLNRGGVLHGGVIATLIDAAGGYAGCFCGRPGRVRRSITISLSTQFLAPVTTGVLTARGRVRGGGKRIFMSTVEVHDGDGTLVALGEGVYRYKSGSETPEGVALARQGEKRNTLLG